MKPVESARKCSHCALVFRSHYNASCPKCGADSRSVADEELSKVMLGHWKRILKGDDK